MQSYCFFPTFAKSSLQKYFFFFIFASILQPIDIGGVIFAAVEVNVSQ